MGQLQHRLQDLEKAKAEFESLDSTCKQKIKEVASAEAILKQFERPLGHTAFEGFLMGQIKILPIFNERLAVHKRVGELQAEHDRLQPPTDAGMMQKTKAKAQQVVVAGKSKLAQMGIGKLEEQIGRQLIASNEENIVRCDHTAETLAALGKQRSTIALRRQESGEAQQSLDSKKQQLAQALQMTSIEGSKSFDTERQSCHVQIAQIDSQRSTLQKQLPDQLLACDVAADRSDLRDVIRDLRIAQDQFDTTCSSHVSSSDAGHVIPLLPRFVRDFFDGFQGKETSPVDPLLPQPPATPNGRKIPATLMIVGAALFAALVTLFLGHGMALAIGIVVIGVVLAVIKPPTAKGKAIACALAILLVSGVYSCGFWGYPPGSNAVLKKMEHKLSAMPAEDYQRLMTAFEKEDADQVAALLKGIDGHSLFTQDELKAISSPSPFTGHAHEEYEKLQRQDAAIAYYQDQSVDTFDRSACFYAGDSARKNRRKYKTIDFYIGYNKTTKMKTDLSGNEVSVPDLESGKHIEGIQKITFTTEKNTEIEIYLDGQSNKPSIVECHKEGSTRYDSVPDSRRVWNPARNMHDMEGFVRRESSFVPGDKLFKIEFKQTGKVEITRGSY